MRIFIMICLLTLGANSFGQSVEKGATYVSQIDDQLTLRRLTVLPVTDNLDGIYGRPLENQLVDLIQNDHHWEFVEAKMTGPVLTPSELESRPQEVKNMASTLGVDGIFAAKATKGPEGVSIVLDLFLAYDGQLFAQEQVSKMAQFETQDLQKKMTELYQAVVAKIPYQGLVLSRSGTRVTLNLGKRDGVTKDQIVTAVQIIKVNRHPRFQFLISSEKEILGKIKLQKVDDTLSFGTIVSEKEKGAIKRFTKISGVDFVNYDESSGFKNGEGDTEALQKPGNKLAFGKQPEEWKPVRPATFGAVNLSLGLGNYTANTSVNLNGGGTGTFATNAPLMFGLKLGVELWITPNWIVEASLRQSVFSGGNPRSGSSPGNLNYSLNKYEMLFGYNFLIRDDFFGPKVTLTGGFTQYQMFVDNTNPVAEVSSSYNGLNLGLKGSFPIDDQKIWTLGAKFNMVFSPSLSESPYHLGDSSNNTMSTYALFGSKRIGQRLEIIGALDFELYSSSYSGGGTLPNNESGINSSQRVTILSGGVNYLF